MEERHCRGNTLRIAKLRQRVRGRTIKTKTPPGDYVDELGPIIGLESAKDRTAESVPPVPSPLTNRFIYGYLRVSYDIDYYSI